MNTTPTIPPAPTRVPTPAQSRTGNPLRALALASVVAGAALVSGGLSGCQIVRERQAVAIEGVPDSGVLPGRFQVDVENRLGPVTVRVSPGVTAPRVRARHLEERPPMRDRWVTATVTRDPSGEGTLRVLAAPVDGQSPYVSLLIEVPELVGCRVTTQGHSVDLIGVRGPIDVAAGAEQDGVSGRVEVRTPHALDQGVRVRAAGDVVVSAGAGTSGPFRLAGAGVTLNAPRAQIAQTGPFTSRGVLGTPVAAPAQSGDAQPREIDLTSARGSVTLIVR